jgi:indolepyruvate decarboxylase
MGNYAVKPIILIANNRLFGIEEFLEGNASKEYNKIAPWNYADLPGAMGCTGWLTRVVSTNSELMEALDLARSTGSAAYIEVDLGEPLLEPLPPKLLSKEYQTEPPTS